MADSDSVWVYKANVPLAILGTLAYSFLFVAIGYLTWYKFRAWYFSIVVVGALIEVVGYICRADSVTNNTALTPYILTLILTVLAPVFVAAGNYLLISRLILNVLPPSRHRILRISGRRLTPIFVTFDVIAFVVQGGGAGIATSNNWKGITEKIGRNTLVAGLVLQFVAFCLFLCIFGRFHFLANKYEVVSTPVGWRKVVMAVYTSSAMIMIRCIYRIAEFADGMAGYVFRKEWMFYVFETVPMIFAIGVFCIYHPARYFSNTSMKLPKRSKHDKLSDATQESQHEIV